MSLAVCSSWLSQAQDARHHGQHGPQNSYVEVHRCTSWTRSFTCPLVYSDWRHGPDSAENCLAIPQVQLIITVVVTPFRCAVAVPHGPDYTADHGDSTVVRIWWSMSLFAGSFPRRRAEADSMVQTVRRTFFFPSVHGGHVPVVQVVLVIPIVVNDRCARLRLCRILLRSRSCCSSSSSTIPCCGAEVDPHGPRDHGESTVAVLFLVVDVPFDRLCRFFVIVC